MQRERFSPGELAVVISHYDLGVIESARDYPRGSRRSPKLLIKAGGRRYLLKRRARGRDRAARVLFSHALLWHLRNRGFPVPRLVRTRTGQDCLRTRDGRVYELFEYQPGSRYDFSLEQTYQAGKTLARLHRAVRGFQCAYQPRPGGYHDSPNVRRGLVTVPETISSHDSVVGFESELVGLTEELGRLYEGAADAVNRLGYRRWPTWIIHGDWHPGNMLFDGHKVCAVLDFDSARRNPAVLDLANGLLQFSIIRSSDEPDQWPEFFDLTRMKRFFRGYVSRVRLDQAQLEALVPLMVESLIAECVVPVAITGSLGQIPGFGVLQMARRKVQWLVRNADRLREWMLPGG